MSSEQTPEVLVAGAGPVGLFAALSLTRLGIRVQIVDTGVWACAHSYALALHPKSLKLLREAGLDEAVLRRAYPVRRLGLYDSGGRRGQLHLGSDLAVMPQDVLEHLLENALRDRGVQVLWRHEITALVDRGDRVFATVDRYEQESRGYVVARSEWVVAKSMMVEASFVIGADGYNSAVRRALNFAFSEVAPPQYYAVFEFKSDLDLEHELRVVMGDQTTDVLWPMPNGYCRWSFQLPDYRDSDTDADADYRHSYGFPSKRSKDRFMLSGSRDLPVLNQASLEELLAQRAPWFHPAVIDSITWCTLVRFEKRLASRFGAGRMWLAGDAAHLAGPAGVQSLNSGLAEAGALSGPLARILQHGTSPHELDAFNDYWTAVWRQIHGIQRRIRPRPQADPWIAAHADRLPGCLPALGEDLAALTGQVGIELEASVVAAN